MLNNVVGYWAYIRGTYIWGAYIWVGLCSGRAYIWNELSVIICDGLIFRGGLYYSGGGGYSRGWGLIVGGFWYNDRENFTYIIRLTMGES